MKPKITIDGMTIESITKQLRGADVLPRALVQTLDDPLKWVVKGLFYPSRYFTNGKLNTLQSVNPEHLQRDDKVCIGWKVYTINKVILDDERCKLVMHEEYFGSPMVLSVKKGDNVVNMI